MISVNASPEIIQKMKVHTQQKVRCYKCGCVYWLVELQPKLFIDPDPKVFRAPDKGGNGYNYDCPACHVPIYMPRW